MSLLAFGNSGSSSVPLLPAVDPNDLLYILDIGQSNQAGPTDTTTNANGPLMAPYTGLRTSKYWLSTFFQDYQYSTSSVASYVSLVHLLDAAYPGQVRWVRNAVGGTRLRTNTTNLGDANFRADWNFDSLGNGNNENYERTLNNYINPSIDWLIANEPGKNIRLINIDWMQGEADATLNPLNGDDPGLTGAEAKALYKTDFTKMMDGFLAAFVAKGISTSECLITIGGIGPGSAVTNRDFFPEISEAQQELGSQYPNAMYLSNDALSAYDGTHYDIPSMVLRGIQRFDVLNPRFAA